MREGCPPVGTHLAHPRTQPADHLERAGSSTQLATQLKSGAGAPIQMTVSVGTAILRQCHDTAARCARCRRAVSTAVSCSDCGVSAMGCVLPGAKDVIQFCGVMTSISIFMATFRVETIVSDFVGVQGASSHCITKPWCGSGITDVSRMHHGCIAQDACELQQSCELCIEAAAQSATVCRQMMGCRWVDLCALCRDLSEDECLHRRRFCSWDQRGTTQFAIGPVDIFFVCTAIIFELGAYVALWPFAAAGRGRSCLIRLRGLLLMVFSFFVSVTFSVGKLEDQPHYLTATEESGLDVLGLYVGWLCESGCSKAGQHAFMTLTCFMLSDLCEIYALHIKAEEDESDSRLGLKCKMLNVAVSLAYIIYVAVQEKVWAAGSLTTVVLASVGQFLLLGFSHHSRTICVYCGCMIVYPLCLIGKLPGALRRICSRRREAQVRERELCNANWRFNELSDAL